MIEFNTDYEKGYGYLINKLIVLGEIVLLNLSFAASLHFFGSALVEEVSEHIEMIYLILNVAFATTLFVRNRHFQHVRIIVSGRLLKEAFEVTLMQFVAFSTLLYLLKQQEFSRLYIALFYACYFVVLSAWWLFVWVCLKRYRRSGFNFRKVLIVGGHENASQLYEELTSEDTYGYRVLGYFNDVPSNRQLPTYLGRVSQVFDYMRQHKVDELYCALDGHRNAEIQSLLDYCENNLVRFFFVPSLSSSISRNMKLELVGSTPVLVARKEPLDNYFARIAKRALDLSIAIPMTLLSPLWFLPIALLVKLSSPGPVLFKQLRTGKNGEDFWCLKFRSMRVNAASDTQQATRNDPRKTRVGNFLRRTNLDELPQVFNILMGDMSIVGPRPHMLKHTI
jgi:putative colanic acid biosynthesis UDP-glucose lipid carrier transferase